MKLEYLFWELAVLGRAVQFANLSIASRHVGLSQPQLSRIVKRIEDELDIRLINRESKRNSSWTPLAYKLSEEFTKGTQRLKRQMEVLTKQTKQLEIRMASLEGLHPLAISLSNWLYKNNQFERIELDIHDIGDLENHFVHGHYDIILSFREPAVKKYSKCELIGYQEFVKWNSGKAFVGSHFEVQNIDAHLRRPNESGRLLVSNSLRVREAWLNQFGGHGFLPGTIRARRESEIDQSIIIIGSEETSRDLWLKVLEGISEGFGQNLARKGRDSSP